MRIRSEAVMKLNQLIFPEECLKVPKKYDCEIEEIITNVYTRVKPNSLFIAYRHLNLDIENLINCLPQGKNLTILCDESLKINNLGHNIVRVKNVRKISALVFARFYKIDFSQSKFIAITGTNGKSSTATILEHILIKSGENVGFIGTGKIKIKDKVITSYTYSMTTPDVEVLYKAIKEMQNQDCRYIILEVSSHALHFEKVSAIPFEIGVFTNLSEEHLDFHSTIEDYFQTKLRLFDRCKYGVFNMDNEYSRKAFYKVSVKKYSIGIIQDAEVMARDVGLLGITKSEYIYREPDLIFKVELNLGGAFNVYNSIFAIKCALILGVSASQIKRCTKEVSCIEGRNEIINEHPMVIIDYAHTPYALENELKTINTHIKIGQNIITVFGCGGNRDRTKRAKMGAIAEKFSNFVIVTADNSRNENLSQIFKDILKGFKSTAKRKVITSRENAIKQAIMLANDEDIILLVGKGHEKYNIDKDGEHHFDERAIVKEALQLRKRLSINENTVTNTSLH